MGGGMAAGRYKAYIVHTGIVLGPLSACAPPPSQLPKTQQALEVWRDRDLLCSDNV
jgi:hypothetical protein